MSRDGSYRILGYGAAGKKPVRKTFKKTMKAGGGTKTVYFQVEGYPELERRLNAFEGKHIKATLRKATRSAGKKVLEIAKRLAPRLTGALAASLKVRSVKRRRSNKGDIGVSVQTSAGWFKGDQFYAAFIEFGTRFIESRSYMRQAVIDAAPQAQLEFRTALTDAIDAASKS